MVAIEMAIINFFSVRLESKVIEKYKLYISNIHFLAKVCTKALALKKCECLYRGASLLRTCVYVVKVH